MMASLALTSRTTVEKQIYCYNSVKNEKKKKNVAEKPSTGSWLALATTLRLLSMVDHLGWQQLLMSEHVASLRLLLLSSATTTGTSSRLKNGRHIDNCFSFREQRKVLVGEQSGNPTQTKQDKK
jgi:hypothetical protein